MDSLSSWHMVCFPGWSSFLAFTPSVQRYHLLSGHSHLLNFPLENKQECRPSSGFSQGKAGLVQRWMKVDAWMKGLW